MSDPEIALFEQSLAHSKSRIILTLSPLASLASFLRRMLASSTCLVLLLLAGLVVALGLVPQHLHLACARVRQILVKAATALLLLPCNRLLSALFFGPGEQAFALPVLLGEANCHLRPVHGLALLWIHLPLALLSHSLFGGWRDRNQSISGDLRAVMRLFAQLFRCLLLLLAHDPGAGRSGHDLIVVLDHVFGFACLHVCRQQLFLLPLLQQNGLDGLLKLGDLRLEINEDVCGNQPVLENSALLFGDLPKQLAIHFTNQADRNSCHAGTSGAAHAMDVLIERTGHVAVDDRRNTRNIETARGQVGHHQKVKLLGSELGQHLQPLFL
eukprot:m.852384 g.852384  ORF g.852384 m.852384 type:complete len:327 (-) comp59598_c0_seq5:1163-2143(-)